MTQPRHILPALLGIAAGIGFIACTCFSQPPQEGGRQGTAVVSNSAAGPVAADEAATLRKVYDEAVSCLTGYDASLDVRLKAWATIQRVAEAGLLEARITVAEYDAGIYVVSLPDGRDWMPFEPNLPRAMEYFRDAAAHGHAESKRHLALLYSSGIGDPRNESESPHNLLIAAAAQGDSKAMLHLGDRYLYGHGERVDLVEAAQWIFMGCQNDIMARGEWVDDQGNAKLQDSTAKDETAGLVSLLFKAIELKDAAATAALTKRYAEAGRSFAADVNVLKQKHTTRIIR